MLGAAHLGERRVSKLFAEFGAETVEAAIRSHSRRHRAADPRRGLDLEKTACSTARRSLDDDSHGHTTTSGSRPRSPKRKQRYREWTCPPPIHQSTSFVNSSHANMQAAVAMVAAYLIDAEIPKNTGALRR